MKVYTIKNLIQGFKVNDKFKGKTLVCCRSDRGYTHIQYSNNIMKLGEPLTTIPFPDKYGRGNYYLDYYEWKPVKNLWDIK